jgi:predicted nucleic acid-binding Zn ribbon protein
MTTATIYTYTCKFCEAVADAVSATFKSFLRTCEAMGRARAASELARQGFYDAAKALMLENKDVK